MILQDGVILLMLQKSRPRTCWVWPVDLSHHVRSRAFTVQNLRWWARHLGSDLFSLFAVEIHANTTLRDSWWVKRPDICDSYDHWCYIKNQQGMMRGTTSLMQFGAMSYHQLSIWIHYDNLLPGFFGWKHLGFPVTIPLPFGEVIFFTSTPFSAPFCPHDVVVSQGTWKLSPLEKEMNRTWRFHHFQVPCWIRVPSILVN